MAKHTEASMIGLLHDKYGTRSQGNGRRYVAMSHVRSDAGFDAKRTADFMALDLWPSKGLALHGHEVKISRSDWLNELKDPSKSGEFMKHVDYWWLVITDAAMVKVGELPQGWGMMTIGGDGQIRVVKQAPKLTVVQSVNTPVHRGLVASMLRSAASTSMVETTKTLIRQHQEWKDTHELAGEEYVVTYRDPWAATGADVERRLFPSIPAARSWRDEQVRRGRDEWKFHLDKIATHTYRTDMWADWDGRSGTWGTK